MQAERKINFQSCSFARDFIRCVCPHLLIDLTYIFINLYSIQVIMLIKNSELYSGQNICTQSSVSNAQARYYFSSQDHRYSPEVVVPFHPAGPVSISGRVRFRVEVFPGGFLQLKDECQKIYATFVPGQYLAIIIIQTISYPYL